MFKDATPFHTVAYVKLRKLITLFCSFHVNSDVDELNCNWLKGFEWYQQRIEKSESLIEEEQKKHFLSKVKK